MIVLMRHAETEGGEGRCIGRTDLALSPEGREQAAAVAGILVDAGFWRLCSSPARRAVATLYPLVERLRFVPEIVAELNEINMGSWDGLSFARIKEQFPHAYAERGRCFASFRPPSGESFADVADRAMAALGRMAEGRRPVLAVTHAGVIRSILCRLTGHSLDDLFHFKPGHVSCTVINPGEGGFRLVGTGLPAMEVLPLLGPILYQ
ncbi:histidine phosphatase family protein [Pseudodesulfovibrio sp.]|uniref:histidine phosphatase family protein n=1 Tax=unclassified Pseudodesulfovibrio TaxID=2661612 RepID=UPI003B009E6D